MEDPNEVAFRVIQHATGADEVEDGSVPKAVIELVARVRHLVDAGKSDREIAGVIWPMLDKELSRHAAARLGQKGGKQGGKARAKKLSAKRRKEIARKAAKARWSKEETKD